MLETQAEKDLAPRVWQALELSSNYEPFQEGDPLHGIDHVTSRSYGPGVACYALGWETAPDQDTAWTGIKPRTGQVLLMMVGDDRPFPQDPDDCTPLARERFCGECGQVGCAHDGYDREGEKP